MYKDYYKELNEQKQLLESQGFVVGYICIYGSQNYDMDVYTDEYKSDIDMKAVIIPTLDDLINDAKPYSKMHKTAYGECDVKDIREWTKNLCKGNPTYLETICTNLYIMDSAFEEYFLNIRSKRSTLVEALRAQTVRAMYGMMMEKHKAMCHPYPTIKWKIDKWGYDGKQCHHVLRLYYLMYDYFVADIPYHLCLDKWGYNYGQINMYSMLLKDLKENKYDVEFAKTFTEDIMERGKKLRDKILLGIDESLIDYSPKYDIINISKSIIKERILQDVGNNKN